MKNFPCNIFRRVFALSLLGPAIDRWNSRQMKMKMSRTVEVDGENDEFYRSECACVYPNSSVLRTQKNDGRVQSVSAIVSESAYVSLLLCGLWKLFESIRNVGIRHIKWNVTLRTLVRISCAAASVRWLGRRSGSVTRSTGSRHHMIYNHTTNRSNKID